MTFVKCSKKVCRKEAADNKLLLCEECWKEWDRVAGNFVQAIVEAKRDDRRRN